MKGLSLLSVLVMLVIISCSQSKIKTFNEKKALSFYKAVNESNYNEVLSFLGDSIIKQEGEYVQKFSKREWVELLKWDAVFEGKQKVIEVWERQGFVKAKISK